MIWASTWLVKLHDMTNELWPVAQPRLTRRPSASRMRWRPFFIRKRSTWGLMFWTDWALALSQATSISTSKWPMSGHQGQHKRGQSWRRREMGEKRTADDGIVGHGLEVLANQDVTAASGGDEDLADL